ncbi:hypothetical protein CC86DRAFT_373521 [Ophiobolus disseminans]|uniref:Uncharacterized protein n=1 Tax=Ophiobolus disseminans TaxID=1469910 RepID=A0A6A6ZM10_9PLEO|nr:hypothetical protein CC86DRAFT_373521 [Ophiobolus disseminans]
MGGQAAHHDDLSSADGVHQYDGESVQHHPASSEPDQGEAVHVHHRQSKGDLLWMTPPAIHAFGTLYGRARVYDLGSRIGVAHGVTCAGDWADIVDAGPFQIIEDGPERMCVDGLYEHYGTDVLDEDGDHATKETISVVHELMDDNLNDQMDDNLNDQM